MMSGLERCDAGSEVSRLVLISFFHQVFKPNCFRIGMKLEAEDRKNELICVATVADMLDNRLRINFDSWDEMYDYWVEPNSPYIHPVGWAEENELPLTPPNCKYF